MTTPTPARLIPRALPPIAAIAALASISAVSLQRRIFNYGTETDFLGSYVPEATRLLAGQPMLIEYHPPAYPIALAAAYGATGDWLRAGLLLAVVSAAVALWSAWRFCDVRYGRPAAVGAVGAMLVSGPFIGNTLQAAGDMFFLALVMAALALLTAGELRERDRGWLGGGLLLGLAILSRTNGIALVLLLLAAPRSPRARRATTLALAGLLLPIGAWLAFAHASGAPFAPRSTHQNLALTYLADGDRTSGDALRTASAGIDSAWDVVARNPRRVARIYVRDLAQNVQNPFSDQLLPFPLSNLALVGLAVLAWVHLARYGPVIPVALVAMFLLLNFKAWEPRYYLFLVPFLGAGIGAAAERLHAVLEPASRRPFLAAAAGAAALLVSFEVLRNLRAEGSDLSWDASEAAAVLDHYGAGADAVVVARKPHLCFYAGVECESFPDVGAVDELRVGLHTVARRLPPEAPLFLFYGWVERETRPGLDVLLRPAPEPPPWLRRVGNGRQKQRKWVLFEVVRGELGPVGPAGQNGASDAS